MRRFVEDGIVEAFALWSPYDEGYLAGYLGVDLVNGVVEAKEGVTFDVPNLGERVFRALQVVITGPPTVFTNDNIGDFDF
jgi:rhamnose transport system substrate-binding protein